MGLIAIVKNFARKTNKDIELDKVTLETGGGVVTTCDQFGQSGDDSPPLVSDSALLVSTRREGSKAVVGYVDSKNKGTAEQGEKRIYSRDSEGQVVAEVWLKNDGSIVIVNDGGSIALESSGVIDLNGVKIDTSGNITTSGKIEGSEVKAGVISLTTHKHISAAPGSPSSPATQ